MSGLGGYLLTMPLDLKRPLEFKNIFSRLVWLSWLGVICAPKGKVAGLIPGQVACLSYRLHSR